MTIQFLGVTYRLYDLSLKIFDREIRLRLRAAVRKNEDAKCARVSRMAESDEEEKEKKEDGTKSGEIAIWGQKPGALPFKVPGTYPLSAPRVTLHA